MNSNDDYRYHTWISMPLRQLGNYYLASYENECWISGIAFGKNLWNHAYNHEHNYFMKHNGGTKITGEGDWHGDYIGNINNGEFELFVPIIPNNKNKILYIV